MKKNFILFAMLLSTALLSKADVTSTPLSAVQQSALSLFNYTIKNINQQMTASFNQLLNQLQQISNTDDITKIFTNIQAQESIIPDAISSVASSFQSPSFSTDAINKLLTIGYEASQMNAVLKSALGKQDEPFISDLPTLLDYQNQLHAQPDGKSVSPHLVINGQVKTEGLADALNLLQQIKTETAANMIDSTINSAPPSPTQQIFNSLNAATDGANATAASATQGNAVESYYQKILTVLSSAFDSDPMQSLWNAVQNAGATIANTIISGLTQTGLVTVQPDGSVAVIPNPNHYPALGNNRYLTNAAQINQYAESHDVPTFFYPRRNIITISPIVIGHMLNGQFLTNKIWNAYTLAYVVDSNGNPLIFTTSSGEVQLIIKPDTGMLSGETQAQRVYSPNIGTTQTVYVAYDHLGKTYLVNTEQDVTTKKWSLKIQHVDNLDNVVLLANLDSASSTKYPISIFDNSGKNASPQLMEISMGQNISLNASKIYNSGHYLLFNSSDRTSGFESYLDQNNQWNFKFIPDYTKNVITQDLNGNPLIFDQNGKQLYYKSGDYVLRYKNGSSFDYNGGQAPDPWQGNGTVGMYNIYNEFKQRFVVSIEETNYISALGNFYPN